MNNKSLRIVAYICFTIVLLAFVTQGVFGGPIASLKVDSGRYYFFDHDKYTEVTLESLLGLSAMWGAAALAFSVGAVSSVWLVIRMKRPTEQPEPETENGARIRAVIEITEEKLKVKKEEKQEHH